MVRLLLEYNVEILKGSENTDSPIIELAATFGDEDDETIEILKMLIREGVDVNAVDSDKETALMYASRYDDLEAIEILLAAGADTSLKNDENQTAFDLASEKETVDLFHRYGIYM
jgi:ankyrin repeat protein